MSAFDCTCVLRHPLGRPVAAAMTVLSVFVLGSCSDSTGPEPGPPPVGAVALDVSRTELQIGDVVQIIATVLDTSGVVLQGRSVTWSSSATSIVSVTTGGLVTAEGPGMATVRATSGGVSGELTFTVIAGACRAEVALPTTLGQTHDENLTAFDCILVEGPFADGWTFTLSEQTAIAFTMTSRDFDAFLIATDTGVTRGIAADDDGAGGTDARMFHVFDPGTYIVWATSLRRGALGAYRLTSEIVHIASCDAPIGSLDLNGTVTHSLTITSCVRGSAISDPWALSLSEDTGLQLSLSSFDFDAVLALTDAEGRTVAYDDDSGLGTNALIQVNLTAGDYVVWVTSFTGTETGTYTLTVGQLPAQLLFRQAPEDVGVNYGAPHYADDFVLTVSATLQELRWWGSSGAGATTAVRLFADDGRGNPRIEPFFELVNPPVQTTLSTVVPRAQHLPVYENRVALSNAPVLESGRRYYVSISGPSFWLSSTEPGTEWWSRSRVTDPWSNSSSTNPNNLAFLLLGVPVGQNGAQEVISLPPEARRIGKNRS